jgi:hypothetical protein
MRALIPALLIACAAPPAAAPRPALLPPCTVEGVTEPLRCGTLAVWEDRGRRGRTIGLKVVVVPSTSPTPAPDPLFVFEGGPGASATRSAGNWARATA